MRTSNGTDDVLNYDAQLPEGMDLVGAERLNGEPPDLTELVIRQVRTEVAQYRALLASYAGDQSSNSQFPHAGPGDASRHSAGLPG